MTNGILVDVADLSIHDCTMTAFMKSAVHFVTLDSESNQIKSIALTITHKTTEFSFQEKGLSRATLDSSTTEGTAHNCLIDCHADVWTRFPVVPAIRRRTITTSTGMQPKALFFVADRAYPEFVPYWDDLITQFERRTRKPTEKELSSINVHAFCLQDVRSHIPSAVSTLLAGE
jgi:hypothetical protein